MDTDFLILGFIILSRILIPLLIPKFPLPAILASLILDAIDHPLIHNYTNLNMDGYQNFDKALDVYYLVIAYIATMRNWNNPFAFKLSKFLIYYRLVGVVLFEFTQIREILFIFPNTFEYFFIFYEIVALTWNPIRMSKKLLATAAVAITVFIKFPQEYIVHIAQPDLTKLFNTYIFHVEPTNTPIFQSIMMRPGITGLIIASILGLLVLAWWLSQKYLPAKDWKVRFSPDISDVTQKALSEKRREKLVWQTLGEKIILITMVSLIFTQMLPGLHSSYGRLVLGIILLIIANAGISEFFIRKKHELKSLSNAFFCMMIINTALIALFRKILPNTNTQFDPLHALLFVFLLTLMVVLFDTYRRNYYLRFKS